MVLVSSAKRSASCARGLGGVGAGEAGTGRMGVSGALGDGGGEEDRNRRRISSFSARSFAAVFWYTVVGLVVDVAARVGRAAAVVVSVPSVICTSRLLSASVFTCVRRQLLPPSSSSESSGSPSRRRTSCRETDVSGTRDMEAVPPPGLPRVRRALVRASRNGRSICAGGDSRRGPTPGRTPGSKSSSSSSSPTPS